MARSVTILTLTSSGHDIAAWSSTLHRITPSPA
jgi:hypothetical protein